MPPVGDKFCVRNRVTFVLSLQMEYGVGVLVGDWGVGAGVVGAGVGASVVGAGVVGAGVVGVGVVGDGVVGVGVVGVGVVGVGVVGEGVVGVGVLGAGVGGAGVAPGAGVGRGVITGAMLVRITLTVSPGCVLSPRPLNLRVRVVPSLLGSYRRLYMRGIYL